MKIIRQREVPSDHDLPDSLHPVLQRVYAARKLTSADALERTLRALAPLDQMGGVERAAEVLAAALRRNAHIIIVGDFDADGATSSALAVRALRAMGHQRVDYLVPNRFEYGYGLSPEIVALAATRSPDVLVTVDNGISSISGVEAAKACGMQVIVTDHHLPGAKLPAADAIVNPNLPDDAFPSKALAGVGVIFYVMSALRARLRAEGWFAERGLVEPNLAAFLDLVALGTVADVVPLDRNNRILVDQGLRRIRAGQCCVGITALLESAGRDPRRLVAADLGFAVGPRLNAAGRLEDMSLGIECLLTDDLAQARRLARELDELNRQRREIETQMREEALVALGGLEGLETQQLPAGICLMDEGWHQGVIGILASRIKERLHRPVIAFAPAGEGELKGSARSVPGLHMRDLLDRIATMQPGLITKFGGHAMAAGLSLPLERFDAFRSAFEAAVADEIGEDGLQEVLYTDGALAPEDFDLGLAEAIREAGPWGQNFPEPEFDGTFEVVQSRIVGNGHVKLTLRHPEGGQWLDGIAFGGVERGWHEVRPWARIVYRLDVNEFRGRRNLQLIVSHLEAAQG